MHHRLEVQSLAAQIRERRMRPVVTPLLIFAGQAENAMAFYVSLFSDGAVTGLTRHGKGGCGAEGTILRATFTLNGQNFLCLDGPPAPAASSAPSASLFITCKSACEVDRLFAALADGGEVLMPLEAYPFSPRCGRVNDRFGVTWQVALEAA